MRIFLILLAVVVVVVLCLIGLDWSEKPTESDSQPIATQQPMRGDMSEATAPPKIIRTATPEYPETARKAGIEGDVLVRALVDTLGMVTDVEIAGSSDHKLLDDAALAATRDCRYRPALNQGTPHAAWVVRTVEFRLDDAPKAINPATADQEADYDTPPQIVRRVDPVYPAEAKAAGKEGSVLLSVRVTEKGRITAVRVLESPGEELGFDKAGFEAIRKYTFKPAMKDGKPVAAWITERIEFHLD